MATIPDVAKMDRAQFNGQRQVVTPDVAIQGAGYRALGGSLEEVSRDLKYVDDVNRKGKVAEADLIMATALEKSSRAFDDRSDHDAFIPEFDADVQKARDIASQIVDERDRAGWGGEQDYRVEVARGRVDKVRQVKWRDGERASLAEQLERANESAVTGDLAGIGSVVDSRLDTAFERGIMDAEEVQQTKRKWRETAAVSRLSMMDEQQAYAALFEPAMIEALGPAKLGAYRQQYKGVADAASAQSTADSIYASSGGDEAAAYGAAFKISDPKKRQNVLSQLNARMSIDRSIESQMASDNVNGISAEMDRLATEDPGRLAAHFLAVRKTDTFLKMPLAARNNLMAHYTALTSGAPKRKKSDPGVLIEVNNAVTAGEWDRARDLMTMYDSGLTDDDRVAKRKEIEDRKVSPKTIALGVINELYPVGGTGDAQQNAGLKQRNLKMQNEYSVWEEDFNETNDRAPTADEARSWVKANHATVSVTTPGVIWDSTEQIQVSDLDEKSRDAELVRSRKVDLQTTQSDVYSAVEKRVGPIDSLGRRQLEVVFENERKIHYMKTRPDQQGVEVWEDLSARLKKRGRDIDTEPQATVIAAYNELMKRKYEQFSE